MVNSILLGAAFGISICWMLAGVILLVLDMSKDRHISNFHKKLEKFLHTLQYKIKEAEQEYASQKAANKWLENQFQATREYYQNQLKEQEARLATYIEVGVSELQGRVKELEEKSKRLDTLDNELNEWMTENMSLLYKEIPERVGELEVKVTEKERERFYDEQKINFSMDKQFGEVRERLCKLEKRNLSTDTQFGEVRGRLRQLENKTTEEKPTDGGDN